jgi:hypothetical protein
LLLKNACNPVAKNAPDPPLKNVSDPAVKNAPDPPLKDASGPAVNNALDLEPVPDDSELVPDGGAAAVSAAMARRRENRSFMAERLLELLQDGSSGGRGKTVSYVTIHAMWPRAQLRRGATLAQASHERLP